VHILYFTTHIACTVHSIPIDSITLCLYRAQIKIASCSVMTHISRLQSVSLDLHTFSPDTLNLFSVRNNTLHRVILYKFNSGLKKNISELYCEFCLEELPIIHTRYRASVLKGMGSAFCCVTVQRLLEISYRRFGKTYRPTFKGELGVKNHFKMDQ